MSRSTDPGHFFQTDASEATRARRAAKSGNKNGDPIILQSKILDVIADPFSTSCLYIAESAGCIRKVNIETQEAGTTYRGPTAPLTSVAIGGAQGGTVFAGCWDKDVWHWERESKRLTGKYKGHSDFVKAVISGKLSGRDVLISGGADSRIMVWDTTNGTRIHTLRDTTDTMRTIQCLAIDPVESTTDELILVSSSSDPIIRRWKIGQVSASQIFDSQRGIEPNNTKPSPQAIREHETSVYKLVFDSDEGDLWTASADGTAKCLSRSRNWRTEETIEHGDYVRAVALTPDWIITAGRDEDVKVWDRSTGKIFHVYEGHFEEVTGLTTIEDKKVASVGIDGTIRIWPLTRSEIAKVKATKEDAAKGILKEPPVVKKSLLTEEEEAELAELMGDEET